jgi:hypothetical protein
MLYDAFRKATYNQGIEVNLGDAFSYLRDNADNRFARRVASKVFRSDPNVMRSLKHGEEMMSWSPDQVEEYFSNLPREEIQDLVGRLNVIMPIETAADMYHNLNLMFGKSKIGGVQKFATEFKGRLDAGIKTALDDFDGPLSEKIVGATVRDTEGNVYRASTHHLALEKLDKAGKTYQRGTGDEFITSKGRILDRSEATQLTGETTEDATDIVGRSIDNISRYNLFEEANAFARKHGERLEKKIIEGLFKKLGDEKPASVIHMFQGSQGMDTYDALRKFFQTSGTLTKQDFERSVTSPLRHRFLSLVFDEDTGQFSGAALKRVIDTAEKRNGPEYLNALFGPHASTTLREAANTLSVIEKTKSSDIIIKMMQASVLMGGAGMAFTGKNLESSTIQNVGMGVMAVGLLPLAAARIMSNPTFVRTLTDGMAAGPGTGRFARAVMVAVSQNRKALADMAKMSPEAQEFYDKPYLEEEAAAPERPMTFGEMGGTMGAYFPNEPVR